MRVWICGNRKDEEKFQIAENELRSKGYIPVNPIKLVYALPEEISNADFTVIAFEVIRICDAVYLLDGWEQDLCASLEKSNADRKEKIILKK